jgi:twinkle protein
MNLVEYLQSKGIETIAALNNGQTLMSPCPFCGKISTKANKHFLATQEVGHCFACGKGANLFQVIQHFGDKPDDILGKREHIQKDFRNAKGDLIATWTTDKRRKELKALKSLPDRFLERSVAYLWSDGETAKRAREYLIGTRKFTEEALKGSDIGLALRGGCSGKYTTPQTCKFYGTVDKNVCPVCGRALVYTQWMISIPYLAPQGGISLVKYRSIPPDEKGFSREEGGETSLYGGWQMSKGAKSVVVVEAELDAVACRGFGERYVVSIAGASNWNDGWLSDFQAVEEIILAGDMDDAGREAMQKLSGKLGAWRCKVLEWPDGVKDAAQYQEQGATSQDYQLLRSTARPVQGQVWLRGSDLFNTVDLIRSKGGAKTGIRTGWNGLDDLLNGIRPGEVTIVTSDTGSGKSLFTNEWALRMALQDVPSAVASFELNLEAVTSRVLSQVANQSFYSFIDDDLQTRAIVEQLNNRPYFMLNLRGEVPLLDLKTVLQWGVTVLGIRFIVLDHLHYFLPGMNEKNERSVIDNALRLVHQWADEWTAHIVIVVHPRKLEDNPRVERKDLKGSSGIQQEADNILALYRARGYEAEQEKTGVPCDRGATELSSLKVRSQLGREGKSWFWFHKAGLTYEDMNAYEASAITISDMQGLGLYASRGKKKKGKGAAAPSVVHEVIEIVDTDEPQDRETQINMEF